MFIIAFISLLVLGGGEGLEYVSSSVALHKVPDFSMEDLLLGGRDDALHNVLTTTGLLAVRIPVETESSDVSPVHSAKELLRGLCDCRTEIKDIPGGESTLLLDGRTTRSTIATATYGNDALSLPIRDIDYHCARGLTKQLEDARYQVTRASNALVPALDRLLLSLGSQTILPVKKGEDYTTVASIIEDRDTKHLEHFHVYSKHGLQNNSPEENDSNSEVIDKALDWHTDAGLFLAFLPAVSCTDSDKPDNSFRIRIPTIDTKTEIHLGSEMQAIFPDERNGEIVVALMLGAGAENWLHTPTGLQLRAARHAVKMSVGEERVWYGKMHLVPERAIIEQIPEPRTFGEMKESVAMSQHGNVDEGTEQSDMTIGCGNSHNQVLSLSSHITSNNNNDEQFSAIQRNRLLRPVAGDCTGSTDLFCWMGCRDIVDNGSSFDENVKSGKAIYCHDAGTLLATDDLQKAVDACTNVTSGVVGGIHNKNCTNSWKDVIDGVKTHLDNPVKKDPSWAFKKSWGVLPTILASMFLAEMVVVF